MRVTALHQVPVLSRNHAIARLAIVISTGALVHCGPDTASPSPEPTAVGGSSGTGGSTVVLPSAGAPSAGTSSATAGGPAGGSAGTSGGGGASSAGVSSGGASAGSTSLAGAAGVGGGSSLASCKGEAIVCEDFESYAANAAPAGGWKASQRGAGAIVVDTTRAFRGKQSLHVTGRMNADLANISKPIQTTSQKAYVRFMLYSASYPSSSGVHTRLLRIGTPQAAGGLADSSYAFASYNGTAIEKVNSIYQRSTTTHLSDAALLNRWTCWEFAVDKTGGIGKVKVQIWLDGRELTLSAAGSPTHGMTSASWDPIPFETIMLGLDGFQEDPQPADFWIDEISVTPERVGCDAAP